MVKAKDQWCETEAVFCLFNKQSYFLHLEEDLFSFYLHV